MPRSVRDALPGGETPAVNESTWSVELAPHAADLTRFSRACDQQTYLLLPPGVCTRCHAQQEIKKALEGEEEPEPEQVLELGHTLEPQRRLVAPVENTTGIQKKVQINSTVRCKSVSLQPSC